MNTEATPRVFWLTEAYFPPIVGGQELMASHLTRGLAARNLGVQVITRQTIPPSAPREALEGVLIRRINPPGTLKGRGLGAVVPLLGYLFRLTWILVTQ
ncbi:MAG: hypothetical protein JO042_15505, partial [Sinobacteraceae bacterium]|nr:hypothetical protein [Nevskiaceae bacterium]